MNQKALAGVSALASLCLTAPGFAQTGQLSLQASGDGVASSAQASEPLAPAPKPLQPARFELGLFGGVFFPSKNHELIDRLPHTAYKSPAPELGARIAAFPIDYLGVEIEGAVMPDKTKTGENGNLWAWRAHVIGQLPLGGFTPFALVGGGGLGAASSTMGSDLDPAVHFGLGGKVALDDFLSLRLDLRDTLTQKHDSSQGTQTHHPEILLGLTFSVRPGKPPPAPPPAAPVDQDGDGFIDAKDRCPTEPGTIEGCPMRDMDGDGVLDEKDACPNEVGKPPCGCPLRDADGDKVIDELDRCPNEAGPVEGCPDPDSDHDGILSVNDRCPDQPETKNGYNDADGCPDEIPEKVRKFTGVIRGIEFDTAKDTIRRVSTATLDNAVVVLKEFPTVRVLISGHTDTDGNRETNLDLSKRRADSVKAYFVSKGVADSRIETLGAGPDEPIADNKTAAGKQKNRRIEFKLIDEAQSPEKGQP